MTKEQKLSDYMSGVPAELHRHQLRALSHSDARRRAKTLISGGRARKDAQALSSFAKVMTFRGGGLSMGELEHGRGLSTLPPLSSSDCVASSRLALATHA